MSKLFVTLFAALVLSVQAVHAEEYIAGKHYEVLPQPVATRDKNKVEVVELFWYGCGHCFTFEPMLSTWAKQLPEDVDFHQVPAVWNKTMELHAKAFFTANALKVLDKTHQAFFNALNIERKRLNTQDSIGQFYAQFGVDKATFDKTFNSFGINSQVKLAESRATSYRMQGTPEIVVNGKYRVAGALSGSHENMLKVARFLVEKERAAAKN